MSKTQQTSVSLVLEGPHDEVMEFVNMAIGDRIVRSLSVAEPATNGGPPSSSQRAANARATLKPGDRVVVTATALKLYNVTKGETGTVVEVRASGHGRRVNVKWDGNGTSECAMSLLRKTRKTSKGA